jgi:filamentous hemagglutinin family protein
MSSKKQQVGSGGRRGRRNANGLLDSAGGALAVAVSAALSGIVAQSAEAKGGIKVEKVARGTAQFTTRGANTQIRVSDRAIINYRQFNVGRNEGVQFIQPSAQSRVLNRINSGEPSRIDGRMSANGIVYLVNPSGVMFGRDSVVNVGRLYAAAANISDGDFVNGVNRFVGGIGAVVNEGTIHADAVTLVGRRVINQGEILSTTAVTMVAGDDVLVGERDGNLFVKVDTVQGLGNATGNTASTKGPAVRMGAGDMFSVAVYNEGKVRAKQITAQSGPGGATIVSGTLDASSKAAGE